MQVKPLALGVDYAVRHSPDQVRCLRTQGATFVVRYLTLPSLSWKRLTREEAQELTNLGMNIVSVYQARMNVIGDFTISHADRDAEAALKNAEEVGQPKGTVIYFAVDFDAGPEHKPQLYAYFGMVIDKLSNHYRVGVYGSYWTCESLAPLVPYLWQTYAWSKGKLYPGVHLYQFHNGVNWCNGSNDLDYAYKDPGWWRVGANPVTPSYSQPWPFWRVMKRGDRGPDVAEVQRLLLQAGFDPKGIDGIFGPNTEAAVKAFQQANGLLADGVIWTPVAEKLLPTDWRSRALTAEATIKRVVDVLKEGGYM